MGQKVRFSTENKIKIDLDDGSFVVVKGSLDYESVKVFASVVGGDEKKPDEQIKIIVDFLPTVLLEWNFIGKDEKIMPLTKENIEKLDLSTLNELFAVIMEKYQPEKKSSVS